MKKHNKKHNKKHKKEDKLDYKLIKCPECKNKYFKIKDITSHLMRSHSYNIIKAKEFYFECKNLPDWEDFSKKNDIFNNINILSGGGFGLGKNRKH